MIGTVLISLCPPTHCIPCYCYVIVGFEGDSKRLMQFDDDQWMALSWNAVEFTVTVASLLTSHTDLGIGEIMCTISFSL